MTKRLKILQGSLIKKTAKLDAHFKTHFDDVAMANGQPMNDKNGGDVVLRRWDRQSDTIRNIKESIAMTERAIAKEQSKIERIKEVSSTLPDIISDMLKTGELQQWRKYPHIFFVKGVKRARLVFKNGEITHSYGNQIATAPEVRVFKDVFSKLSDQINVN